MSTELADGLRQRIPQLKGLLWQVFEGQYEPASPDALSRYLRGILALVHAAGLDALSADLLALSRRLALPETPGQDYFEEAVRHLLADLEIQAALIEDPPAIKAHVLRVAPGPEFFSSSLDLARVIDSLQELGRLEVYPDIGACPVWEQADPQRCSLRWDMILLTGQEADRVQDVLDFLASEPGMSCSLEEAVGPERLRQIRLGNRVAPIELNPKPSPDNPAGYRRRNSDRAGETGPAAARSGDNSIRMSIERLDKIINAVGELVTAEGRLKAIANRLVDTGLSSVSEEVERLTVTLRDASMHLRMQPVGALFSRFHRLVRDLSQQLGKQVQLVLEGEETELDRSILEKLYDPMVHIIRNSLDHGIEAAEQRLATGKAEQGTIAVRAYQQGSEVVIEVQDDGGGIRGDKVLAKAREKGLVHADAALSEQQMVDLIFLPGFSTASAVSDVSGRGVGMDVVKSNVEALRGQVEVSSRPGEGTTMSLRFPLTMAIIDGLEILVAGDRYILPLDPVEECLELARLEDGEVLMEGIRAGRQGLLLNLRGDGLPLFSLAAVLAPGAPPGGRIIVVRSHGQRLALLADRIEGRLQVVIKPLGPLHLNRRELSGATILGDGGLALVLDLPSIIRRLSLDSTVGKTISLG